MKKKLLVLFIALLCFGNVKAETTTIEEANTANKILFCYFKTKEIVFTVATESYELYEENKDEIKDTVEKVIEDPKGAVKENFENAEVWYEENKDDLKLAVQIIYEDTKETVMNIVDKSKSWYEENKDEIKAVAKEAHNKDKEAFKNLYDKLKNNE